MAEAPRRLFVYGTLRRGAGHPMGDQLGRHTASLGPATAPGQLFDTGRYPAAVHSSEADELIHGELYEIDDPDEVLIWLDEYEGYFPSNEVDSLFVRRLSLVNAQSGGALHAWMYWYNRPVDGLERITSGRYE